MVSIPMNSPSKNASTFLNSSSDLRSKIFSVILMLVIYRIGTYIPIPGIDSKALSQVSESYSSGLLGIFNMFTGGAISRLSIFALNIMPYITASIVMQLVTTISKDFSALKKDSDSGRKKIQQLTRYLTLFLAMLQGYGIAAGVESMASSLGPVVPEPGLFFRLTSTLSLMTGTLFVMWLGEKISLQGVGNGSSIIIFTGIISGLPSGIIAFFEMNKAGAISIFTTILLLLIIFSLLLFIVFCEKAQRKILIQYPRRQVGNKIFGGDSSYLPLKVNIIYQHPGSTP